jgi:hypothetical protein
MLRYFTDGPDGEQIECGPPPTLEERKVDALEGIYQMLIDISETASANLEILKVMHACMEEVREKGETPT